MSSIKRMYKFIALFFSILNFFKSLFRNSK